MRDLLTLLEDKSKPGDIEPVKLGYSESSLSPVLGAASIRQHQKLWQGYCDRFNRKEGDSQFNYAGFLLHTLYFTQFRAPRTTNPPNGPIGNLIKSKFKSWEAFQEAFEDAALKFHGSGWIYLARDGSIKTIVNHSVRQDIALICDLWEHAYMSDYGSDKRRYIKKMWTIMDWNAVNSRYMAPYK
jgi:Fe-Mn family superoxide dismutase